MKAGIQELLHDEVEEQFEQLKQKKRKRRRKFRRIRNLAVLVILAVGIFYFLSDYSKVKSLRVVGNRYYSDEQILEIAGLDYDSRFLLHPSFWIQHLLEKEDLIASAKINKNANGGITIEVKEKTLIGYLGENKQTLQVLDVNGDTLQLEKGMLGNRADLPYIHDFSKTELANLAAAFKKLKDESYIQMISEIMPHAESYDAHMVKLIMQDGNSVFVAYQGIALLTHYKDVLKPLEGNHVCLWIDEETKAIAKRACPSETAQGDEYGAQDGSEEEKSGEQSETENE